MRVTKSSIIDFEFDWARDGVYCASCHHGAGNWRIACIDLANQLWIGQVYLYATDTGVMEQLINEAADHAGAMMRQAPEYMVFNGKPYVFFQMNVTNANGDLLHPDAIGMTGILPETLALLQLTPLDSPARLRMDPEYFINAQGPFIYDNRCQLGSDTHPGAVPEGVWRVDTGLGAPGAHNFRGGH